MMKKTLNEIKVIKVWMNLNLPTKKKTLIKVHKVTVGKI